MTPKTILFAGAPDPSSVSQSPSSWLTSFTSPISTFLGLPEAASSAEPPSGQERRPTIGAAWRSLPLERRHLETGFSQVHHAFALDVYTGNGSQPDDADFFTTASISVDGTAEVGATQSQAAQQQRRQQILSQFCDHSLAQHQGIASSQLPANDDDSEDDNDGEDNDYEYSTSLGADTTASRSYASDAADVSVAAAAPTTTRPPLGNAAARQNLSDLEDIPSAKHVLSLAPATVTVNLIAGVVSVAAPRTVATRWGTRMSLVEVLLGDETKAGFGVTFWLPASTPASDDNAGRDGRRDTSASTVLAETLAALRRQDVVLVQNVALNVFMGKVYGQSLRRNLTSLHLLYRRKLDAQDLGGYYTREDMVAGSRAGGGQVHPQLEKTRRVREWLLKFVGGGEEEVARKGTGMNTVRRANKAAGRKKRWGEMPDDTQ